MSDSTEAKRIKKYYCRPAIYIQEHEWTEMSGGKFPNHYHVERYIWADQLLPEWRVAVAEDLSVWRDDEKEWRAVHGGIQTRFVTYKPTGKQIYDNTLPPARAVVFEYELEHYQNARALSRTADV